MLAALLGAATRPASGPPRPSTRRTTQRGRGEARRRATKLDPPGPIPGYLLIADRGNNRMLLVDSAHHLYWRYPSGDRVAMPFVFDEDTFFGPKHDRVISNQEDQDTIQIVSFPGRRCCGDTGT